MTERNPLPECLAHLRQMEVTSGQHPKEGHEAQLLEWLEGNSYVIAMAVVGAYSLSPEGSGVDLSLGNAGDVLVRMFKGERDPMAAVRAVIRGPLWDEGGHWLPRWQAPDSESRLIATERPQLNDLAAIRAAERERCAKAVDETPVMSATITVRERLVASETRRRCAAAIRALGEP